MRSAYDDPWLAELVRRADAGEPVNTLNFEETPETKNEDYNEALLAGNTLVP